MTREEIKRAFDENKIDRRKAADKLGISPNYLTQILTGWAPLKEERKKQLEAIIQNQ